MRPVEIMIATGGDPIAAAIAELVERDYPAGWKGSVGSLYWLVANEVDIDFRFSTWWPWNDDLFRYHLQSLTPALRRSGIVVLKRRGDDKFLSVRPASAPAAERATGQRMGIFTLDAAEMKAVVDSGRLPPSVRAAIDALRRDPGALALPAAMAACRRLAAETRASPFSKKAVMAAFAESAATMAAWRRVAAETRTSPFSREAVMPTFAAPPPSSHIVPEAPSLGFARSDIVSGCHSRPAKPLRAASDALRRNRAALARSAATMAAWRRVAAETQASRPSREPIMPTFAAPPPSLRVLSEAPFLDLARLRALCGDPRVFPLLDVSDPHEASADLACLTGARGAKPFDGEGISDIGAAVGDGLSDELAGVARALTDLARRVDALQGRCAAMAGQPPDDDPLLAVGWVAKAFGKEPAAIVKQAKRRGLHVPVGGRVCIRLSDLPQLYPQMSRTARLVSALAACAARAKRG